MHITKKFLLVPFIALSLLGAGCEMNGPIDSGTDYSIESSARRAIEAQGFTDIQLGSTPLFECAKDDSMFASYKFTAKNVNGVTVRGAACCGGFLSKGCTIRF